MYVYTIAELPLKSSFAVAGVPENITVVPSSSTSLIVSWDPPLTGEDSVVGYIVEYVSSGLINRWDGLGLRIELD